MKREHTGPAVWVTRYALTKGILKFEASRPTHTETMVAVPVSGGFNGEILFQKPHFHFTEIEAQQRVQDMAKAKLRSLAKAAKAAQAIVDAGTCGVVVKVAG